jgi:hypothetical protein
VNTKEILQLQAHLRTTFSNETIKIAKRSGQEDSVEVNLDGEFIGIIYKDIDEGEISYQFHMAIIEEDLPEF